MRVVARVRYWDLAATESDEADFTAGPLMGLLDTGDVVIEDLVHGRYEPGTLAQVLKQTAIADGKSIPIVIEQEPGSGGKSLIYHHQTMLMGWAVHADKVTGDKVTRAMPLASYAQMGRVKIIRAGWNGVLLSEFEVFPNGSHDDIVDACSGAFNWLAAGQAEWNDQPLIASGSDDAREERKPLAANELEDLPDYLRQALVGLTESEHGRAKRANFGGFDEDRAGW